MKKLIKIDTNYPKLLKIFYDLGNTCNYKCWYCFPESNQGDKPWPDANAIKVGLVALVNHYRASGVVDDIELLLLGGEPTLWSKLTEVTEYLLEHCKVRVIILTNGARTVRWWKEYSHHFDNINISVHHESADIDHIIEVSKVLHENKSIFSTNVLMDHKEWDKCIAIVDRLLATEEKWPVLVKPIHINGIFTYTDIQKEYLNTSLKRLPSEEQLYLYKQIPIKKYTAYFSDLTTYDTNNPNWFGLNLHNRFQGWECDVGVVILFINSQGFIHSSCGQQLYGTETYYNISDPDFEEKFKPIIAPVICTLPVCGSCTGNLAASKRKID